MKGFGIVLLLFCSFFSKAQDIEQALKEKPWDYTGSIGGNFSTYSVDGITPQSNPYFWSIYGNFTPIIYGFKAPFRFVIGRQEQSFERPFIQMGISPTYKWATLHIGTRNMMFSKYTLANHSFNGAGIELTPGKWRFAAMYGQFRKANEWDSTDLNSRYRVQYKRLGYGAKLGYGGKKGFVEFSYFKAWDEASSLTNVLPDTTLTPAENAVFGINIRKNLGKHIDFFTEAAVSAYTRDVGNAYLGEDLQNPLLKANITSRLNYAGEAGFSFQLKPGKISISYQRIMPEFETMGAYFMANDVSNIKLAPSFRFFKNKLNINGAVNYQTNNLENNRLETTERIFGTGNFTFIPNARWGLNGNVISNNVNQTEARLNRPDSVRVANISNTFGLTPYVNFTDSNSVSNLSLVLSHSELNDKNVLTRQFTDFSVTTVMLNWVTTKIRTGLSINVGGNINVMKFYQVDNLRYGATVGGGNSWKDGKLTANISNTFNLSTINAKSDGFSNTTNGSVSYLLSTRHVFSLNLNLLYNKSNQFVSYTELRSTISYVYTFR